MTGRTVTDILRQRICIKNRESRLFLALFAIKSNLFLVLETRNVLTDIA